MGADQHIDAVDLMEMDLRQGSSQLDRPNHGTPSPKTLRGECDSPCLRQTNSFQRHLKSAPPRAARLSLYRGQVEL